MDHNAGVLIGAGGVHNILGVHRVENGPPQIHIVRQDRLAGIHVQEGAEAVVATGQRHVVALQGGAVRIHTAQVAVVDAGNVDLTVFQRDQTHGTLGDALEHNGLDVLIGRDRRRAVSCCQ